MGEMLRETDRAKGKRTDLVISCNQVDKPTLSDLGLTKRESAEAQMVRHEWIQTMSDWIDDARQQRELEAVPKYEVINPLAELQLPF